MAGGHADLIGELAREGDAEEAALHAAGQGDAAGRHVGERGVGDVARVDEALQQRAGVRPRDGELGPLLGDRDGLHVEVRPQPLQGVLDVLHHLAGIGRGGGHQIMVVAEARCRAVVEDEPVLAQHQAVACPADGQRRERVGVEPVEQPCGVRALDVDLAQRRDVADADRAAHRLHLAGAALQPVCLAGPGEPLRAQPDAALDEGRALFSAAQSCAAVRRVGRNALPVWWPPSAPIATGV